MASTPEEGVDASVFIYWTSLTTPEGAAVPEEFGAVSLSGTSDSTSTGTVTISGTTTPTAISTIHIDAVASTPGVFEAPENIVATADSPTQVTLTWSDAPEAESYDIERDGVIIKRVAATSYTDTGLSPRETYTYRVRSIKYEVV